MANKRKQWSFPRVKQSTHEERFRKTVWDWKKGAAEAFREANVGHRQKRGSERPIPEGGAKRTARCRLRRSIEVSTTAGEGGNVFLKKGEGKCGRTERTRTERSKGKIHDSW